MRISYSEDEEYGGQFELWQANCQRSLRGKKGQAELRVLRDALLALPEKRLISGALERDGDVCAIACYGKFKGIDLEPFKSQPDDWDEDDIESDQVGIEGGMPRLVAWKVVEMNDMEFDHLSPEKRYERMLAWVERQLSA